MTWNERPPSIDLVDTLYAPSETTCTTLHSDSPYRSSSSRSEHSDKSSTDVDEIHSEIGSEIDSIETLTAALSFARNKREYGANQQRFDAFKAGRRIIYGQSAAAGQDLNNLNDEDGVLLVNGRDGQIDRFAVLKDQVDHVDHYFIQGYMRAVVHFESFDTMLQALVTRTPEEHHAHLVALEEELRKLQPELKAWKNRLLETPLRSEVLRLSLRSELRCRRNKKESAHKLTCIPPNPTGYVRVSNWANSESSLCPGAGTLQANGTRLLQIDWNKVENRIQFFLNENGDVSRDEAVMAHGVPGHKAPLLVGGPVLATIEGPVHWQLLGPANIHSGVKGGTMIRMGKRAYDMVWGTREVLLNGDSKPEHVSQLLSHLKPEAEILIKCEDGSVHFLQLSHRGGTLSLAKMSACGTTGAAAIFGVGMGTENITPGKDVPSINIYSYQGRNTGQFGSDSGLPNPELILSTGRPLKVGPLLSNPSGIRESAQEAARILLYQPNFGGGGSHCRAKTNVTIIAASKFATTSIMAIIGSFIRGKKGVYFVGAPEFSGIGSGSAKPGTLAVSTALIVMAQELISTLQDRILHALPEAWRRPFPSSLLAAASLRMVESALEELVRLETNLGIQKVLGLRSGTGWDHGTLAIAAVVKGILETAKNAIGIREAHPYTHMTIDTIVNLQYFFLRVMGMVMSEDGSWKNKGRLLWMEAIVARAVLRAYDQILAPVLVHLFNAQGWVGENATFFVHQLAREHQINNFKSKLAQALRCAIQQRRWAPISAMIGDKSIVATLRTNIDALLVGNFNGPYTTSHSMIAKTSTRIHSAAEKLTGLTRLRRKTTDTKFFSGVDLLCLRVRQTLNRTQLYISSASACISLFGSLCSKANQVLPGRKSELTVELRAGDPDHRIDRAIEAQKMTMSSEEASSHIQATIDAQDQRIRGAIAYGSGRGQLRPGEIKPTSNLLSNMSSVQQSFIQTQYNQLQNLHSQLPRSADQKEQFDLRGTDDKPLGRMIMQPANIDYRLRARPVVCSTSSLGVSPALGNGSDNGKLGIAKGRLRREETTFSDVLQTRSLPRHGPMTKALGFKDGLKSFNQATRNACELALRHYTVNSQGMHYFLRWQETGQPRQQLTESGEMFQFKALNQPGNTKGKKSLLVHPIEPLYINLACRHAPKFKGDVLRAVVTESKYHQRAGDATEKDGEFVVGGSMGVLTEIFSASGSEKVASEFLAPISAYGAVPLDNSQVLDVVQETSVNVSNLSELAQAEVVMMPGALLVPMYVDSNSGQVPEADTQPLGQCVYMRQADSYEFEAAYDTVRDYLCQTPGIAQPSDGTLTVHPLSGQFLRYVVRPNSGDMLFDPVNETLTTYERVTTSPPRGAFRFESATKNYFLGRPLERASNPVMQKALWRYPFTGKAAKRVIKDGTHAAIVAKEPIVEHLDEAVQNISHEYFREKGGFYRTRIDAKGEIVFENPRAQAEADRKKSLKTLAALICSTQLNPENFHTRQDNAVELVVWLLVSFLRRPITLIPVHEFHGTGIPPEGLTIAETYDQTNRLIDPLGHEPEQPILIGVGVDGFYFMRFEAEEGEYMPSHRVQGKSQGRTVENLIQAYLLSGAVDFSHYITTSGAFGSHATVGPDEYASSKARLLYSVDLCDFSRTDYIVLQEALVKEAFEVSTRIATARTTKVEISIKTNFSEKKHSELTSPG